jgi:hypothetical protein
MNRQFPKKEIQMSKKHMKKWSISLGIKNMQIKMTLRFHLTPNKMAIFNNTAKTNAFKDVRENKTLLHCYWECKLVLSLWKTIWSSFKKLKIELPHIPGILLLGISQRMCSKIWKSHLYTHIYCYTIHISEALETAQMPHDWWMD